MESTGINTNTLSNPTSNANALGSVSNNLLNQTSPNPQPLSTSITRLGKRYNATQDEEVQILDTMYENRKESPKKTTAIKRIKLPSGALQVRPGDLVCVKCRYRKANSECDLGRCLSCCLETPAPCKGRSHATEKRHLYHPSQQQQQSPEKHQVLPNNLPRPTHHVATTPIFHHRQTIQQQRVSSSPPRSNVTLSPPRPAQQQQFRVTSSPPRPVQQQQEPRATSSVIQQHHALPSTIPLANQISTSPATAILYKRDPLAVHVFLERYNLHQYAATLINNGFDSVASLGVLTDTLLSDIGMKPLGHGVMVISVVKNIKL